MATRTTITSLSSDLIALVEHVNAQGRVIASLQAEIAALKAAKPAAPAAPAPKAAPKAAPYVQRQADPDWLRFVAARKAAMEAAKAAATAGGKSVLVKL